MAVVSVKSSADSEGLKFDQIIHLFIHLIDISLILAMPTYLGVTERVVCKIYMKRWGGG